MRLCLLAKPLRTLVLSSMWLTHPCWLALRSRWPPSWKSPVKRVFQLTRRGVWTNGTTVDWRDWTRPKPRPSTARSRCRFGDAASTLPHHQWRKAMLTTRRSWRMLVMQVWFYFLMLSSNLMKCPSSTFLIRWSQASWIPNVRVTEVDHCPNPSLLERADRSPDEGRQEDYHRCPR